MPVVWHHPQQSLFPRSTFLRSSPLCLLSTSGPSHLHLPTPLSHLKHRKHPLNPTSPSFQSTQPTKHNPNQSNAFHRPPARQKQTCRRRSKSHRHKERGENRYTTVGSSRYTAISAALPFPSLPILSSPLLRITANLILW